MGDGRGDGYTIGVMKMPVGEQEESFARAVDDAVETVDRTLSEGSVGLSVEVVEFTSPHLLPSRGSYSPLDFLQIGLGEKSERGLTLLLIVTEVELAPGREGYAPAFSSGLINVAVLSTKRLDPTFWAEDEQPGVLAQRLSRLLLHTVGHLLGLPHEESPRSAMHAFESVRDLDEMEPPDERQLRSMAVALPKEARDQVGSGILFTLRMFFENLAVIARTVVRSHPVGLVLQLPTVFAAALSANLVTFFSAEMWDVASSASYGQLAIFSLVTILAATTVLYRAFALPLSYGRRGETSELVVVTKVSLYLVLLLTMVVFYATFVALTYLATVTIFPISLMESWPTVGEAVTTGDHLRLGLFMAAISTAIGSLGSGAERQELIQNILFLDEQT